MSGTVTASGYWISFTLTGSGPHLFLTYYAPHLPADVCCAYCVPGSVLSFTELSYSVFMTTPEGGHCYLNFKVKKPSLSKGIRRLSQVLAYCRTGMHLAVKHFVPLWTFVCGQEGRGGLEEERV